MCQDFCHKKRIDNEVCFLSARVLALAASFAKESKHLLIVAIEQKRARKMDKCSFEYNNSAEN